MAKQAINLLPSNEQEKHRTSPYVEWFFRSGVYILLSTYTIVLLAFGYRWLQENNLTKIKENIKENVAYIDSQGSAIAEFATLKAQYGVVDKVISDYSTVHPYLVVIQETIPAPVVLDRLQVVQGSMTIEGISNDYIAVNQWEADLKKRKEVSGVTLASVQRIETDETSGIDFTFTVTLK